MQCDYFDAGRCRSCTLMGVPYADQLASKQAGVEEALSAVAPAAAWNEPFASSESGFRNKAKLVVAGRPGRATLGILDARGRGVDLEGCGLYEPGLAALIPVLHDLVAGAGIPPYDVPSRSGELKHLLVTHSPDGESMVRFVLRSPAETDVVEHNLAELQRRAPGVRVVTVNLQPEHKAVLEGDEEVVLTRDDTLTMRVNGIPLRLGPRSFFQTNTSVAAGLYRQAREWADGASSVVDLYCGVGGFALHLADGARSVVGVETSGPAVEGARRTAAAVGSSAEFVVADATSWELPAGVDLVVVNPPRRGLGPDTAHRLDASGARTVLYSSCNPQTLARDLEAMPSYAVAHARLFDMFPQTEHAEVLVHLERR